MSGATYLYCVVSAPKRPALGDVPPGIPGAAAVELLEVDKELSVAAATAPLDLYGPEALDAALRNIDWVGDVAMAHERVVEHFAARKGVTVVPMKLFTMFSSPARAIADIAARRASIRAAVRRIAGAEEWGVRIGRAPATDVAAAGPAAPASGAAFLAAKKQKRDSVREARLAAAEAAVAAFETLAGLAKESRRREDPPPAGATPPLIDAAFLVTRTERRRFTDAARQQAEACAGAGAHLTLSGPWPAYSFIERGHTR